MKMLVTAEVNKDILKELEDYGEILIEGWGKYNRKLTEDEMIKLVNDVDILITSYDPITERVIDNCKKLKLLACTRANPVNVDAKALRKRNIPLIYTPGRNSDCTAEFTIAMMLNISRHIAEAYRQIKNGKYLADKKKNNNNSLALKEDVTWALGPDSPYITFKGIQLKGHTLGIIGFGSIGRRVAKLAVGFGMKVYVYDPYVYFVDINDNAIEKVSLDKLLRESDFVSCHCKVDETTRGLIGENEFKMMKKTAYFINSSRGAIVNEKALIKALREKQIAGAALDVFSEEPLTSDHPFITEFDNVLVTPHIGGATYDAIDNHTKMVVEDIKRFLNSETLLYEYR